MKARVADPEHRRKHIRRRRRYHRQRDSNASDHRQRSSLRHAVGERPYRHLKRERAEIVYKQRHGEVIGAARETEQRRTAAHIDEQMRKRVYREHGALARPRAAVVFIRRSCTCHCIAAFPVVLFYFIRARTCCQSQAAMYFLNFFEKRGLQIANDSV